MKLWEICPKSAKHLPKDAKDPWDGAVDVCNGFVIRAETEWKARIIADDCSGDETTEHLRPWLDPQFSDCRELLTDGIECVILRDFHARSSRFTC